MFKAQTPHLCDVKITDFCNFGCAFCFVPGTLVTLENHKTKPIQDIKIGDKVFSFDYRKSVINTVEQIFERDYTGEIIKVYFNRYGNKSNFIILTPEHEVFTSRGWIKAGELFPGLFVLRISEGILEERTIISIEKIKYSGKVYNFGCTPNNNYFANNILVHNCYQGSTIKGKHAPLDKITQVIDSLSELEIFQIAFGGGETTQHPFFSDIIKHTSKKHIVPNFTTFSLEWTKRQDAQEIHNTIGDFAYSISNISKLNSLIKYREEQKSIDYFNSKGSAQIVMGIPLGKNDPKEDFEYFLLKCANYNIRATLLGYKTDGRGSEVCPVDYSDWFDILLKLQKSGECPSIAIDTKLASDWQEQLQKHGIDSYLYEVKEGGTSCYIDVVEGFLSQSSYGDNTRYPLDFSGNLTEQIRKYFKLV